MHTHSALLSSPKNHVAFLARDKVRHEIVEFGLLCPCANNDVNIDMLQRALTALPLTKIRQRAFDGAFFGVTLIAIAGWVYFIALLLVKLFLWFLG